MTMFVIYARLNQRKAQYVYNAIKKWFKNNPDRIDCQTETFKVRRDHLKEDILEHCEKGVKLTDKPTKKKPAKKTKKTTKKKVKKSK